MRIAFVAPFGLQPKGTVSARMMPLAHALAARGHTLRVVIPPWDDPQPDPGRVIALPLSAEKQAGVEVVTLRRPKVLPGSAAYTYGLLREAAGTFRPDVVHVFKPVGYSGLAGLALQARRLPWVLDVDDWEGPGGWVNVNPYTPAQKLAITVLEALLPRLAGAVTAASRTLEARCWGFGLPRRRVLYMPNGVWEEKYGAWAPLARTANPGEPPTLLLYTRFAEFPYSWPLTVLRKVMQYHPGARLLVVGGGFFGEERKLAREAERQGLSGHVEVMGMVPEANLPAILSRGTVAIYPMRDTLINRAKSPVKVLEPMVMGLPIVAHRVGQAAEFLGDAAILVEPGDLDGMARAVSTLLAEPERRAALGRRAQERVWREFNWDKLSQAAEKAYQEAKPGAAAQIEVAGRSR